MILAHPTKMHFYMLYGRWVCEVRWRGEPMAGLPVGYGTMWWNAYDNWFDAMRERDLSMMPKVRCA